MTTFCQVCRGEIPPERVSKKARTCSDPCQKQYRAQMRSERAEKFCRLCGRKFRQRRSPAPVLMEHNQVIETVTPDFHAAFVDFDLVAGVSAVDTRQGQPLTSVTALVVVCANCGKPSKLCNTKNFTALGTLENEVESLCASGAEQTGESHAQASPHGNAQLYSHSVEKRTL